MTFEEAKNKLEEMYVEFDYTLHDEAANASYVAIKALEKQIPKKVIKVKGEIGGFSLASILGDYLCPSCKNCLDCKRPYCDNCGQKLDFRLE